MTNEQALEILEHNWTKLVNPDCTDEELGQALDLAIKALEEVDSLRDTAEYYERELEEKWECGIDEEET